MIQQPTSQEFVALIGIDWADEKHDISIQVPGEKKSRVNKLSKVLKR